MSVLAWNCWGLGASPVVRTLTEVVKQKNPVVIFLVETKASIDRMKGFQNKLGFTQAIIVPSDGRSGGLALLWREGTDIRFKIYSHSYIDAVVDGEGSESPWRVTGFYGHPDNKKRFSEQRTLIRLDRMVANEAWSRVFLEANVHHVSMSSSDHCLLALLLRKEQRKTVGKKRFFFKAMWTREEKCKELIVLAWDPYRDDSSLPIQERIGRCQKNL
nr:hypothetical protein CFP56_45935 [Quercus suber]